ncbi:MAG: hypothetical protein KH334_05245 [Clostridiales bacterium]|nr:hypothetical protein [Clostridiales bacterium]
MKQQNEMSGEYFTIMKDTFMNGKTNKEVEGLTLILDGRMEQLFAALRHKNNYSDNTEVLRDIIIHGVNKMIHM